ncbi:hypothetical protein [Xanthomonas sp. GW]|uniref:hypothetical protein n=1 Tax=Xanthomonas sp. GW TaxID=2724121 RepID=UPI00163ACFE2|nr:hypothetical protein [Xanthomonas sp. GW]
MSISTRLARALGLASLLGAAAERAPVNLSMAGGARHHHNGGKRSGVASAKRAARKRRNIAKHPRSAA